MGAGVGRTRRGSGVKLPGGRGAVGVKGMRCAGTAVFAEKREALGAGISGRRVADEGAAGMGIKGRALLTGDLSRPSRGGGAPSLG